MTGLPEREGLERAKAFAKEMLRIPSDPADEPANFGEVRLAEDVLLLAAQVEQLTRERVRLEEWATARLLSDAVIGDWRRDIEFVLSGVRETE